MAQVEREQRRSTAELIEAGESNTVEYKQTARYNPHTGKVDKRLEHSVLKSIAGFMNASGGVLLIGVHDRQDPTGMADDYSTTGTNGRDGFENWLITKLDRAIGRSPTATLVDVTFDEFPEGDVCRLDVRPSPRPIYLGRRRRVLREDGELDSALQHEGRDGVHPVPLVDGGAIICTTEYRIGMWMGLGISGLPLWIL